MKLRLHPGLDLRVLGEKVKREGHVGGGGVVAEHEGVHLLLYSLISDLTSF